MTRSSSKPDDLAAIAARREVLKAELAVLNGQARAAELAARDAGRPVLVSALDKIKIAMMEKTEAKAIATAIGSHGGKVVADHLATLKPA